MNHAYNSKSAPPPAPGVRFGGINVVQIPSNEPHPSPISKAEAFDGAVPGAPGWAASDPPRPEELVDRYQRRVYAVIYRMTGSHSETDDLCQETFLQIFRSLPRFRPGTLLDSWVYRIATNVSVDYLRRKSKERAAKDVLVDRAVRTRQADQPIEADLAAAAREALETLPPEQKAVVVLRLFEGLGHEEIATIVEAPVATVRWRFFTALEKLSSVLGEAARP